MNTKIKRLSSLFLAFVIFFTTIVGNTMDAFAQSNMITGITVDQNQIGHAGNFKVDVKFGGPGHTVYSGQTEQITFYGNNVDVKLPGNSIPLFDEYQQDLGTVTFSGGVATITFNDYAASLENVKGGFDFYVHGYYQGDLNQDGQGSIEISSGNHNQSVEVDYRAGGTATSELYSKKGVWLFDHEEGNRLDWVFSVNPANVSTNGMSSGVSITDTLPDTMEWDTDFNSTHTYVVQVLGEWKTIDQAREMGIEVNFNGQELTIKVPHALNAHWGYQDPLDGQEVNVRLRAKVKDEVMADQSISEVTNTSSVDTGNLDWDIPDNNLSDSVTIARSGGWISGTKPGEIKIVKKLKDTEEALEGVEFTLSKEDGSDILISQGDGTFVNKGPSLTIVTDSEGKAGLKGLASGQYIIKETKAPEGIKYDPNDPETKVFEITDSDKEGNLFNIYNEKEDLPELTDLSVSKEWKDHAGELIEAPVDSIQVQLLKDGQPEGEPVELNEDNSWSHKFEDLKTSETIESDPYEYTVLELDSEGNVVEDTIKIDEDTYKVEVTGSMEEGYTVTNSKEFKWIPLEPSKRSIEVEKEWKDHAGKEIQAPVDSIKVQLLKDGQPQGEPVELSEENSWSYKFEDLKTSETIESDPYEYTVEEVGSENGRISLAGDTYKVEVTGSMEEGYTVTNSKEFKWIPLEPSKRSIEVEKEWKSEYGLDMNPPVDSIQVELYKDGEATGNKMTLSALNDWKVKFEDLKTSETIESDPYEYTVVELDSEGNVVEDTIKIDEDTYKVKVTGSMEDGFTITNSKEFKIVPLEPSKRSIEVEKEWKDHAGELIDAPVESIKVQLLKDGQPQGEPVELSEENSWSYKFEDLKTSETIESDPYEYTVVELDSEGNAVEDTIKIDEDTYKVEVTGSMEDGFTITNSKEFKIVPLEPSKRSIEVEKEWKDHAGKEIQAPVDSIKVQLLKDGQPQGEPVELSEENSWSYKFEDLKTSDTIESDPYEYTVKEVGTEDGRISLAGDTYKVEVTGSMEDGFTITNSKEFTIVPLEPSKISIEVEKEWKDRSGKTIKAPVNSIHVQLYKDGKAEGEPVELNKDNSWSHKFEDLKTSETIDSDPYEYTVKELNSEGKIAKEYIELDGKVYKVEIVGNESDGFTITNTSNYDSVEEPKEEDEIILISGKKTWDDDNDKAEKRPEEITIRLFADGKEIEKITVGEKDGWKWDFGILPKYKDEKEINYTIKEDSVKAYKSKVDGFNVTNTYKPGVIETIKNVSKGKGKDIPWTGSDPVVSSYPIFILLGIAYFVNKKFNR